MAVIQRINYIIASHVNVRLWILKSARSVLFRKNVVSLLRKIKRPFTRCYGNRQFQEIGVPLNIALTSHIWRASINDFSRLSSDMFKQCLENKMYLELLMNFKKLYLCEPLSAPHQQLPLEITHWSLITIWLSSFQNFCQSLRGLKNWNT